MKSRTEHIVDLIGALAWPTIAAAILISFWTPLHRVADQIPALIEQSDTISIAGLSIKVGQRLQNKASSEVKAVLDKLSPESIKKVLALPSSAYWDKDGAALGRRDSEDLLKLGLVKEISPNELDAEHKNYGFGYRVTDLSP